MRAKLTKHRVPYVKMISRRDKLLIRPWQQKRYENHRRKVQSALPAIDNRPPASREHVSIKLKKQQKETDRIAKIENDNLILLRKMNYIMRTSRVNNSWITAPPSFLNRVAISERCKEKDVKVDEEVPALTAEHIRKSKCSACTPKKIREPSIPEERIPWEPNKPSMSKKRSISVPPRRSSLPTIIEKDSDSSSKVSVRKQLSEERSKSCKTRSSKSEKRTTVEDCFRSPQSIVLSTGCLKLAVNFPSDTLVKLREGNSERLLLGGDCFCKSLTKVF